MIRLGENLRKYRKQKGLTQDELAEKLYVTRQAVSNWENGKNQPDLEMIGEMTRRRSFWTQSIRNTRDSRKKRSFGLRCLEF